MKDQIGYTYEVVKQFVGVPEVHKGSITYFRPSDTLEIVKTYKNHFYIKVTRGGSLIDPHMFLMRKTMLDTHCKVLVADTMQSLFNLKENK